jgi:hypothetical protein
MIKGEKPRQYFIPDSSGEGKIPVSKEVHEQWMSMWRITRPKLSAASNKFGKIIVFGTGGGVDIKTDVSKLFYIGSVV